jgi:hypothetical protein
VIHNQIERSHYITPEAMPMKVLMLLTGSGPMLVLSNHDALDDEVLLGKLKSKGVDKFMAFELPVEKVEGLYGGHFHAVVNDLHETDDLRVLDINGHRIFSLFRLDELGEPYVFEPAARKEKVFLD